MNKFVKENSVFADWRTDTRDVIEKVLENDMNHWKVNKFVKTPQDQKNIYVYIRDNFKQIKEIRMGTIA